MTTLSVIIPTRNRSSMLEKLLSICRRVSSSDIQFVIADNSDHPFELNDHSHDSRFQIVRSNVRLSMADNWTLGLESATGTWRVFVGDDDGLIPNELDNLLIHLKQVKADAVVCRFAHYVWPIATGEKGQISIWMQSNSTVSWTGLQGNSYKDFTNVYFPIPYCRTVFHVSLETKIKMLQQGEFITATSPDINLGAAISLATNAIEILPNITPFIVGTSKLSNGLQGPGGITKKDFETLNSRPWIPDLGRESLATNYMSYVEPIAQARKAMGLSLELPSRGRIVWQSLISTRYSRLVLRELIRIYPDWSIGIKAVYPFAISFRWVARFTSLSIWALRRSLINREKYVLEKSVKYSDIEIAALRLQEVISCHRSRRPLF